MRPEFKPVAEMLLQARVDGCLNGGEDFHNLMVTAGFMQFNAQEVADFCQELVPCNIIPFALELAKKYDLNIKV